MEEYLENNRKLWNDKVPVHLESDFYNQEAFLKGKSSLQDIELNLLGDINDQSILHLQCHFGQDTMSLSRMGAKAVGVDLSDEAIKKAEELATQLQLDTQFVCCDVYNVPKHIAQTFDIVFTSYGTIGWLPDLDKWAKVVAGSLKPGGKLILVEFHPVIWMFDDDIEKIQYSYFNDEEIIEETEGTYADRNAPIKNRAHSWNHSLDEVFNALMNQGMSMENFQEYNYSPYACFKNMTGQEGHYYIEKYGGKLPMVYSLVAKKL